MSKARAGWSKTSHTPARMQREEWRRLKHPMPIPTSRPCWCSFLAQASYTDQILRKWRRDRPDAEKVINASPLKLVIPPIPPRSRSTTTYQMLVGFRAEQISKYRWPANRLPPQGNVKPRRALLRAHHRQRHRWKTGQHLTQQMVQETEYRRKSSLAVAGVIAATSHYFDGRLYMPTPDLI